MSNRCWIAIATIAVAVLGVAVLGVLAPAEHAKHLAAVESGTAGNAESVARIEERIETTGAAVGRIEAKIDTLIQLRIPTRFVRKYTVTPRGRSPRVPMKL